uniref:AAA domain protein n=1 Tax=Siphoviridae sp. ctK0l2 TaxID=2826243 RepID=A0A8S5NKB3_9CAUD|nr:MAG TPA: AAA domain protein [Siphoviridae sp. ctK0l2]
MKLKSLSKVRLHQMTVLFGKSGSGKAEYVENKIYTPDGPKRFGDLKIGDYVFDRFGKPTKVIGTFPQGELDAYEVTLADGRTVICNDEHIWTTVTSRNSLKDHTLRHIIDNGVTINKEGRDHCHFYIPTHSYVQFKEQEISVHPYLVGTFIANGALRSRYLTLSSNDLFVVEKVAELLGATYKKNSDKNFNYTFYKEGHLIKTDEVFTELLDKYSHEKFIPQEYLFNKVEIRRELLQGLMDNDGYVGAEYHGASTSYYTVSPKLRDDVVFLVRSLGYETHVYEDVREGKRTGYDIGLRVPPRERKSLFTLPRKLKRALGVEKNCLRRRYEKVGIAKVTKLDKKLPMMCIKVDNPESLYLSNEFVVTHNTSVINSLPGKTLIIDTDRGLASVSPTDNVDVAECYNWEDILEAFAIAKTGDYESIAVDHFTNVQEMCYKHIMEKYKVDKMQIQHYGEASPLLKGLVDQLVGFSYDGKNVLVLAQEMSINVEEDEGEDVPRVICPNVSPAVRSYLQASARIVAHTQKENKKTFENGKKSIEEVYIAQVAGNPILTTKVTRKPGIEIPNKIKNPTWAKLTKLITGETTKKPAKAKEEEALVKEEKPKRTKKAKKTEE